MSRATFPVAVHLFLLRNDEILMLRRFQTGYEDGNYSVVAGHLDGGEDVYQAMLREAREEAGIAIKRENLEIVQVMHRKKEEEERIDYFFSCTEWDGEIKNMEPEKCDALAWFPIYSLPSNTIGYIRAAVNNYLNKTAFSTFGW